MADTLVIDDGEQTLTNKSGNISMWTNDSGYLTDITGESLGDLSDVNIPTPSDGQILAWNATNSKWEAQSGGGGGATQLSDLSDVGVTTPTNRNILVADGDSWESRASTEILEALYPVGSIYINATDSTNPATLLGFGTWSAFGAGRVLVGLDSGDADFDTAEETGGEKTHTLTTSEMPSHYHTVDPPSTNTNDDTHSHNIQYIDSHTDTSVMGSGSTAAFIMDTQVTKTSTNDTHHHSVNIAQFNSGSSGSGDAHNNLQPYITVYMWKRTA